MKRLWIVVGLLGWLWMPAQAMAGHTVSALISATTLDDSPTSVSGTAFIGDAERVAFFVHYDETDAGAAESLAVTVQVSEDNSTWQSASFYDYAGGSTLQTSETLSADADYYFWFNKDLVAPDVKVILTATGSDTTHTAVVSVNMVTTQ